MEDSKYFSVPALSKSQVKNWNPHNPTKFWDRCSFNPNKKKDEINDAMVFGTLAHAFVFEKDKVMDKFVVNDTLGKSRINKKWQDAQDKSEKMIVTTEEVEHATKMVEALNKHQIIRDLLSDGLNEEPFMWEDKSWGIACKMKLDYMKNTTEGLYVVDLKTTGKIEENTRYIDKGNYHYDVGFYSRGIKEKYGKPCVKFIFIFQSSKEGEENDIRIKVVEGADLEACEIATDLVVKQIVPKIKEYLEKKTEDVFLPELVVESFPVSPWFDKSIAEMSIKEK